MITTTAKAYHARSDLVRTCIALLLATLLLGLLPLSAQAQNDHVTLIEGGPGRSSVEHVVNEKAAYGVTGTGALIERSHGKPVKALGAIFQHSPLVLLVKKDSGIKSWQGLRGKRIMLQQGYQNADIIAALREAGIRSKDYIRQDISYNIQDLIAGRTDAYAAYSTDQPHLLKLRGVPYRILKPADQGVDFYGDIVITSDTEIRKHLERARAFMQATARGWKDALEHVDAAIDLILLKYNTQHLSREQLQFEARASAKLIMLNTVHIGYMNDSRWQRIAQIYAEQRLLPANYPVSEFLYQPEPSLANMIRQNLWWLGLAAGLLLIVLLALHSLILRRTVRSRTQTLQEEHKILLATEEKYEDLYDNAPDMYASVDAETAIILQCNQTLASRLGYHSKDEIIGRSTFDLYHQRCHEDARKALDTCVDTGKVSNAELQLRCKDDGKIVVMLNATAVRDIDGKVLYSRSSWRDISERKIRELFESDQQLILNKIIDKSAPLAEVLEDVVRAIQRQQPAMLGSILLLDEAGKHLNHGAAPDLPIDYCKAIDGVTIGACVGSCGTAAHRKERVIVSDIATDPLWADYKELALKHGLAACWSQPVKDADGRVLGTFAMYYQLPCSPDDRDIRLIERAAALAANVIKRRREEQELSRLAEILQATSDFVGISDEHGKTTFVNEAGRKMMGFDEGEDLSGLTVTDYHTPEVAQQLMQEVFPTLAKNGPWRGQIAFLSRNGREIMTDKILIAHRNEQGEITHYSTVARDITDRIAVEKEQRNMQAQMEHTQRLESLGVLAGGIAHDFNNILTAILGNAAMAERKALRSPQDTQRHLANIVTSSERAADLCNQMLAYSGKGKFVVRDINLSSKVEEISKLLEVSIAKGVVLKYHMAENLPAVEADVAQMQQVIMNLVINASDAIGDKNGVVSISTGVMQADSAYLAGTSLDDALPEGRYVYLEISDTGCGMDKQTQTKVFEPFFTTKFAGHGLGMSAVLGIVHGHHGAIKLYSEQGKGSTFKVLLPMSSQPPEAIALQTASTDEWHGSGTVLIVDDEETIRETAAMMLEDMGFDTMTAVDGEDGVRVYREHQKEIVAVLMDMTMPHMDGKTCFTELRRINKGVNVILSSGYNEQEATSRFTGQSLAGFIQKPYTPDTLREKMQEML